MKFRSVEISNLRAIRQIRLDGLNDLVLIAGPNGVGKSCVLDGLRLLKSAYAGYQPNEVNNWFSEFQINLNIKDNFQRIFRDHTKPLRVAATIELAQPERTFLKDNAESLLRNMIWRTIAPDREDPYRSRRTSLASELRAHHPEVEKQVADGLPVVLEQLDQDLLFAEVVLSSSGEDSYAQNPLLEILWSTFEPDHLGILDFHNAHRHYNYENLGSINLNIQDTDQRVRQHALYGTQSKYTNIKSEMAAAFVRDLIAQKAGAEVQRDESIIDTLKDLFLRFFPGKEFLGPVAAADGSLSFPVRLSSDGSTHDVDFLSSGEKEVLFGYLRLRNSAPRNSIIMIDEPELHLNPRLVKGLPVFYHEHIGKALGNQVWLVTHSDAFLRDAKAIPGASVWHMRELGSSENQENNQAVMVSRESDIERAVIDLVGEVAGYRPGARILIVEGADSEFDEEMITRLFPEIVSRLNIISAGGRTRVEKLHELLQRATKSVGWEARFFAITDRDVEGDESATQGTSTGLSRWNSYHIENYLLEPQYIHKVLDDLGLASGDLSTPSDVMNALCEIATSKIEDMVRIHLRREIHKSLQSALTLRVDGNNESLATGFWNAIQKTKKNVETITSDNFRKDKLQAKELELREQHKQFITNGSWNKHFRGRDILQTFVNKYTTLRYEDFRSFITARMKDAGFQPPEMKAVLEECVSSI